MHEVGSSPRNRRQEVIEARIGRRSIMSTAAALPSFMCKLKLRRKCAKFFNRQRFSSRGHADFAGRVLSAMRHEFGGHLKRCVTG